MTENTMQKMRRTLWLIAGGILNVVAGIVALLMVAGTCVSVSMIVSSL